MGLPGSRLKIAKAFFRRRDIYIFPLYMPHKSVKDLRVYPIVSNKVAATLGMLCRYVKCHEMEGRTDITSYRQL